VYAITVDDSGRPSWMSEAQGKAFNAWQKDHRAVFNLIREMLTSREIVRAQSVFENELNGLSAMLNAFLAESTDKDESK
jgi:hypothetical protein